MKKVLFTTMSIIAVAAMMLVSCKKDNGTDDNKDKGKTDDQTQVDPNAPVQGTSAWSVVGTLLESNWGAVDYVCAEADGIFVLKNVNLKATDAFKFRKDKDWGTNRGAEGNVEPFVLTTGEPIAVVNNGKNLSVSADGFYDLYYNSTLEKVVAVEKNGTPDWEAKPAAGREGKAFKLTAETSENYLFHYTGVDAENKAQFDTEKCVDLGTGSTFQVKFYANSWKDGDCDRLCCFEAGGESPSMLVRFSNDGTQPGQLRFNNNAWRVGGGDGVKLKDSEGNPYIFEAQKWHVLTMVLTPGEGKAVTVDFYDNGELINSANGEKNSAVFYFQRFEFGMSWEYHFNNDEFSTWQLFNGYIDYARVWTRALAASEVAESLCDVDPASEGLLTYWIMNEGEETGVIPNKAGDKAYDINFANMYEMDGGTFRKNLDLKNSFINALEEPDTPLCEF